MACNIFQRYEKKYILTAEQYRAVRDCVERHMVPDAYTDYTIQNIYFDTPDFDLIRRSIEAPDYKEKLRLRMYGKDASGASEVFIELKKKFDHVVYKRRVTMSLAEASDYLMNGVYPEEDSQILREIDYAKRLYGLVPAAFVAYDRDAFCDPEGSELRVTFDSNIRCRSTDLDLMEDNDGTLLLDEGLILMEVKIPGAMPLWMSRLFSENRVFTTHFSKYGSYYMKHLADRPVAAARARMDQAPRLQGAASRLQDQASRLQEAAPVGLPASQASRTAPQPAA